MTNGGVATAGRLGSTGSGAPRSMAGATGLEPATSGVTGRRSNQLSYAPAASIPGEHTRTAPPLACQGAALIRIHHKAVMVGDEGLEPPTPSV